MSQIAPEEKNFPLALALASGLTITAAAEKLQGCRKTMQRRLAEPPFRQLVAELRGQLFTAALGQMADKMSAAANDLIGLLGHENPTVRLRAAAAILSLGLRLRDSVDVTERLRELEEELARAQRVAL